MKQVFDILMGIQTKDSNVYLPSKLGFVVLIRIFDIAINSKHLFQNEKVFSWMRDDALLYYLGTELYASPL